ncbi:MAG TPA: cytochrome P450, partial [Thermomonospora sp.]|nr:cytochrome P450 [Thermomonospora sp.]
MTPNPAPIPLDPYGTDHHGEATRLRQAGPAVPVALPGLPDGVTAWAITRHRALHQVLRDPAVSKNWRNWAAHRQGLVPADWPLLGMFAVDNMFTADGTEHRQLRALVGDVFTRSRVQALRPRITGIIDAVLDALPGHADADGVVDLRPHFAYPIPMQVICELLGMPADWRPTLRALVDSLFRTDTTPEEAVRTQEQRRQLLTDLIDLRAKEPADDLTSALIGAHRDHPEILTHDKLLDTLWLLVTAGHETTLGLLANAVRALLTHPDQKATALNGDDRAWTAVVTETLRWDPPITNLSCGYPTRPLTVGDVTIPTGDALLASYTAAGRDPDEHGPTADRFDITATRSPHLSFGGGPHYCLGAPLATTEAPLALQALFTR